VHDEEERVLLLRIEVGRLAQHAFDFDAVLAGPADGLGGSQIPICHSAPEIADFAGLTRQPFRGEVHDIGIGIGVGVGADESQAPAFGDVELNPGSVEVTQVEGGNLPIDAKAR